MSTTGVLGSEAQALAPAPDWRHYDHRSHVVQFYAEDASLLDALGTFIGSALGAGDAAIVIATKAHLDSLAQRLKARGLDTGVALKQGRYVPLDAMQILSKVMRNGYPEAGRFAPRPNRTSPTRRSTQGTNRR